MNPIVEANHYRTHLVRMQSIAIVGEQTLEDVRRLMELLTKWRQDMTPYIIEMYEKAIVELSRKAYDLLWLAHAGGYRRWMDQKLEGF